MPDPVRVKSIRITSKRHRTSVTNWWIDYIQLVVCFEALPRCFQSTTISLEQRQPQSPDLFFESTSRRPGAFTQRPLSEPDIASVRANLEGSLGNLGIIESFDLIEKRRCFVEPHEPDKNYDCIPKGSRLPIRLCNGKRRDTPSDLFDPIDPGVQSNEYGGRHISRIPQKQCRQGFHGLGISSEFFQHDSSTISDTGVTRIEFDCPVQKLKSLIPSVVLG